LFGKRIGDEAAFVLPISKIRFRRLLISRKKSGISAVHLSSNLT